MYPISYLTLILVVLLFVNKKLASYFYPFIFLTSTFGIPVTVYLIYSSKFRSIFYNLFSSKDNGSSILTTKKSKKIFLILQILFKIVLLAIWPRNVTYRAFVSSFILIFLYAILYYLNFELSILK